MISFLSFAACYRWLLARAMKHIKLKVIKKTFLMIEKNAEKHCNMLMNFTKLELTQVNFHGGKSSES